MNHFQIKTTTFYVLLVLAISLTSCKEKSSEVSSKNEKTVSNVIKYSENGKVEKSEITKEEQRQIDEMTYKPPPTKFDDEYFSKNQQLYIDTKRNYIEGTLGKSPLVLVEDYFDQVKILIILNQEGLIQVINDQHGIQNPYNLENPSIKKASIDLFKGVQSNQSKMSIPTKDLIQVNTQSYFYISEGKISFKNVPMLSTTSLSTEWKNVRKLKDAWQSAYRYSF